MRNTRYIAFVIVMSGFPEIESHTGNDIPSISSDILSPSRHTTSFQRRYDVVQHRTTSYRRWNDVVCLLSISNQKNWCTRFIKNIWQSASIKLHYIFLYCLSFSLSFYRVRRTKSQLAKNHMYKQWLYKCCNFINITSNLKLMTDRKHIKHRKTK